MVIDPITNLITGSAQKEVYSMLIRLMDYLKGRKITSVFTNLTVNSDELEQTDIGISSLTDTWILCRDLELNGERNRCVYVLKSRGMAHSNQIREFVMSREGIRLVPPYIGSGVVLTGSSRMAQEAKEKAEALVRSQEIEQRQEALERQAQRAGRANQGVENGFRRGRAGAGTDHQAATVSRNAVGDGTRRHESHSDGRFRTNNGFCDGKDGGRRKVKKKTKPNGKFAVNREPTMKLRSVCGGADPEVNGGLVEPQANLR